MSLTTSPDRAVRYGLHPIPGDEGRGAIVALDLDVLERDPHRLIKRSNVETEFTTGDIFPLCGHAAGLFWLSELGVEEPSLPRVVDKPPAQAAWQFFRNAEWQERIYRRRGIAETDISPWRQLFESVVGPMRREYDEETFQDRADDVLMQHWLTAGTFLSELGLDWARYSPANDSRVLH